MEQKEKISIEHLINVIIALIGLLLVIIGIVIANKEKTSTIMISVGASLIASSIVAFLSSIYIQRYRRAKEISEIWGILSIKEKRTIMNTRIDDFDRGKNSE